MVKYVFVTGGVVSGSWERNHSRFPGKTVKSKRVSGDHAEIRPYINMDPGTMNPIPARRSLCY